MSLTEFIEGKGEILRDATREGKQMEKPKEQPLQGSLLAQGPDII